MAANYNSQDEIEYKSDCMDEDNRVDYHDEATTVTTAPYDHKAIATQKHTYEKKCAEI